jgi:hypothetical protein
MSRVFKETLVYLDDGDTYVGTFPSKPLKYWLEYGRKHNQKYLYKGFRRFFNSSSCVVVFSNSIWYEEEIARRRANGLLCVREYEL